MGGHDLDAFGVDDLVELSASFREAAEGASTMAAAATGIVGHLFDSLGHGGRPAVALARLYKTHPWGDLDPELQAFASSSLTAGAAPLTAGVPCLTLLATAGLEPDWNDCRRSAGHRAIPLTSAAAVERSPMIAGMLGDLGVDLADVLAPSEGSHHRTHDVFFVADAHGSPTIPAQADFVVPYGIGSVLGVGGFLPSGDMFALILFLTVNVRPEVAELFRTVALSLKATLVPFTYRVFAPFDA